MGIGVDLAGGGGGAEETAVERGATGGGMRRGVGRAAVVAVAMAMAPFVVRGSQSTIIDRTRRRGEGGTEARTCVRCVLVAAVVNGPLFLPMRGTGISEAAEENVEGAATGGGRETTMSLVDLCTASEAAAEERPDHRLVIMRAVHGAGTEMGGRTAGITAVITVVAIAEGIRVRGATEGTMKTVVAVAMAKVMW